ncbi:MAG: hypothetical protein J6T10_13025 [Methanobrevibacter sp.]|nr:hypothetical protein [Methanobrevibacter sp.]
MITEDYVSFEIAKLLKEKDFDKDVLVTDWWYDEKGNAHKHQNYSYSGSPVYYKETCCHAPTLQMAIKWLREVHHFHIFTVPRWEDVEYISGEWEKQMIGYQYVILDIGDTNRKINQPITTALSPESSYEAAIKYCLENLI